MICIVFILFCFHSKTNLTRFARRLSLIKKWLQQSLINSTFSFTDVDSEMQGILCMPQNPQSGSPPPAKSLGKYKI